MFENANEGIDVVLATAHFGLSANLEILVGKAALTCRATATA